MERERERKRKGERGREGWREGEREREVLHFPAVEPAKTAIERTWHI
jgi:hypothetical protein